MNLPPCFCPENSPTLNLAFQVGDGWFTARGVRFEVGAYTDAGPSARDSVQGDWPACARPWRATHSVPMTNKRGKPLRSGRGRIARRARARLVWCFLLFDVLPNHADGCATARSGKV